MSLFIVMITWDQVMLVQLAAQFFVLVALNYFPLINVFNFLIIILKFSIKKSHARLAGLIGRDCVRSEVSCIQVVRAFPGCRAGFARLVVV